MAGSRPLGALQWAVIALAAATAFIHIGLAFLMVPPPDPFFLLNGIGYIILVVLLYLPVPAVQRFRNWVAWALIVYTAATIALWTAIGIASPFTGISIDFSSPMTWLAYVDKLVEIALIVLVWLDWQRGRQADA
jgi:hypothetical protein